MKQTQSNVNQSAGSVRQLADGKWQATITIGEGRGAPKKTKRFSTRKEANAWLAEMKAKGAAVGGAAEMTVAAAFDNYVESNVLRPNTAATFNIARDKAIAQGIGATKLKVLKPSHVRAFSTWMMQQGLGPTTVNLYAAKLNAVLRFAAADGAMTFTPTTSRVKVTPAAKLAAITAADVEALYDSVPETFAPAIIFGAFAGMRASEAAAITVADIDFMHSTVNVNKAMQEDGSFGPTKTPGSVRTIPLSPPAVARLGVFCKDMPPDALVATNVYGGALLSSTTAATFGKAAATVGLDITFHSLRKFFATTLLSAGVNPVNVAEYLGDTVEVMLKTYALKQPGDDEKARKAMAAAFETVEAA